MPKTSFIARFDIFPKFGSDVARETNRGAILTIIAIVSAAVLAAGQAIAHWSAPATQQLIIDETALAKTWGGLVDFNNIAAIPINFHIQTENLPCSMIHLGVTNAFGGVHGDATVRLKLKRLDAAGREISTPKAAASSVTGSCGSCYGMQDGCCETCKDVRRAFKAKGFAPPPAAVVEQCRGRGFDVNAAKREKCSVSGTIVVPPIKGGFYIAPGSNDADNSVHVAEYKKLGLPYTSFNVSHSIKSFYIGDKPEKVIDGVSFVQGAAGRQKWTYSAKALRKVQGGSEEFITSVTVYGHLRQGVSTKFPGVYFDYDISPIVIQQKRSKSLAGFILSLMSILGGVFAIGTIIDRVITPRPKPQQEQI